MSPHKEVQTPAEVLHFDGQTEPSRLAELVVAAALWSGVARSLAVTTGRFIQARLFQDVSGVYASSAYQKLDTQSENLRGE